MKNTITLSPEATQLLTAWTSAKEAERAWTEYRRQVEDQLLAAYPALLPSLEEELQASNNLSVSAEVGPLKLEVKRSIELDQTQIGALIAGHPYLVGTLFKCSWGLVASRPLFTVLAGSSEVAAPLKEAVKFKLARPYFTQKQ